VRLRPLHGRHKRSTLGKPRPLLCVRATCLPPPWCGP
jgi:hypothetical protein